MISVIIPTIKGREQWLDECVDAYASMTRRPFEIIVEHDHPGCGWAWKAGGDRAHGDYLHFTADDVVPASAYWAEAAIAVVERGELPCPRIVNPKGELESCGTWGREMAEGTVTDIARVPFLSRKQWEAGGWCLPCHYFTDNWISFRGEQLGYPTVIARSYTLVHGWAPRDMDAMNERMRDDYALFRRARRGKVQAL